MARGRTPVIVIWLAIAMIALIAYGSLYPFNLKPTDASLSWWESLRIAFSQLAWARAGFGDRVLNVLLYTPLGFCLALWFDDGRRSRLAIVAAVVCCALLSFSIEVAQVYISTRVASLLDVTLNACGAFAGAIGGVAWRVLGARLPNSMGNNDVQRDSAAWVILTLWVIARWAPFSLHFSLGKIKASLQPLYDPTISVWQVTTYLIYWVLIAQLVFAVTSRNRNVEWLLATIALSLVGQLFVVDHAFASSELVALVLLLPVLVALHKLWPQARRWLLLAGVMSVVVVQRFAPFTPADEGAYFDLWPMIEWRNALANWDWVAFAARLFEYAALYWVLREVDVSRRTLAWLLPSAALAIEIIATWVPGTAGSIAEPLWAWCVVALLNRLSENRRSSFQRAHSR